MSSAVSQLLEALREIEERMGALTSERFNSGGLPIHVETVEGWASEIRAALARYAERPPLRSEGRRAA